MATRIWDGGDGDRAMRSDVVRNTITGGQRTSLAPFGRSKALVAAPRWMMGHLRRH